MSTCSSGRAALKSLEASHRRDPALSPEAKAPAPGAGTPSPGIPHAFPSQNTFRTPVYTTSTRRNAMGVGLVFEADLFTTRHISHWVLQGVCLTLNCD